MRLADYVVERISGAGAEKIFQVTGRGALFLSDAVAKSKLVEGFSMHHEQACAFAAIGYAEQSGKIGACLVSTGCASTNAITGLLCAWQDGVPCIFLSGQNTLKETTHFTKLPLRTYGQQEADIISVVKPMTKYAVMVTNASEIEDIMDKALFEALNGRKGPVWIDIPLDLQSATVSLKSEKINKVTNQISQDKFDYDIYDSIINGLKSAKRPVILIGRGVRGADTEQALRSFVEKSNIPVTYTASAPDTFGTANKLSIGSVGTMGCSRAGNFAVQNSDFLLVLGSRLTSLNTGVDFCKFAREARVAVVDIDPHEHMKETIKIDHFLEANLKHFFRMLQNENLSTNVEEWVNKCLHWKKLFGKIEPQFNSKAEVDLYQLTHSLSQLMPARATVITDSGLNEVIIPSNLVFGSGVNCVHPASQGAMGFALPAAIGAAKYSDENVLAIVGDGSIMMNLQELQTISGNNIKVKIIVINNNVYSIIRRRQQELFRNRTIGTDPQNGVSCPSFEKVAECFSLKYQKINSIEELDDGLTKLLADDGPLLCEIVGRPDQSYIEVSHARSEETRKFVRRPLEDQAPFLDRDLFFNEMIVDIIDQ